MIHPIRAMKAKLITVGLLLVGAATVGMPAFASTTATTTFNVTATVTATCTIAATAMTFATAYTGSTITAQSQITATCTNTTPYTIGLNAGTTTGATTTNRLLAGPSGATLPYQLYSDSGHTTVWGNATGSWVSGTGNGSAQAINVYGQILGAQLPAPGTYTDTVTATITY